MTDETTERSGPADEPAPPAQTQQQSPPAPEQEDGGKSSLKKLFTFVAGVAIPGAVLTTGILMLFTGGIDPWATSYERWADAMALLTASMSVWSVAATAGAFGFKGGEWFDQKAESAKRMRAWATGLGMTFITAAFMLPLSEKIHDWVHDGLTGVNAEQSSLDPCARTILPSDRACDALSALSPELKPA